LLLRITRTGTQMDTIYILQNFVTII